MASATHTTTRRALLASVPVLAASSCAPALASSPGPSPEMQRLFAEHQAAAAALDAAMEAEEAAAQRFSAIAKPLSPEVACRTQRDIEIGLAQPCNLGRPWEPEMIEAMRSDRWANSVRFRPARPEDGLPEGAVVQMKSLDEEGRARVAEIVRAHDEHVERIRRAERESGVREADAEYQRAREAATAARAAIAAFAARTIPDLILKASAAADCAGTVADLTDEIAHDVERGEATDITLMQSLLRDILSGVEGLPSVPVMAA